MRPSTAAPDDPVARIVALVRADFDPAICNRRTLTLWYAFWGEATARPLFASISEGFDRERAVVLREQCEAAADLLDADGLDARPRSPSPSMP